MATRKKPADPKLRILALDPELSPYRSDLKLRMRLYGEAKKSSPQMAAFPILQTAAFITASTRGETAGTTGSGRRRRKKCP